MSSHADEVMFIALFLVVGICLLSYGRKWAGYFSKLWVSRSDSRERKRMEKSYRTGFLIGGIISLLYVAILVFQLLSLSE